MRFAFGIFLLFSSCLCYRSEVVCAQEDQPSGADSGTIIIETGRKPPEPQPLYTAASKAVASASTSGISQSLEIEFKIIQGTPRMVNVELRGEGDITEVSGDRVRSWGVRREGDRRFLDIYLQGEGQEFQATVIANTVVEVIPASLELLHLAPGESLGFSSTLELKEQSPVRQKVVAAEGFASLQSTDSEGIYQSNTGGRLVLELSLDSTAPPNLEVRDATLSGNLDTDGKSVDFQLSCTIVVNQPESELTVLSGGAAVSELPQSEDYRLTLSASGDRPVYRLVFPKSGTFAITLRFVAPVIVAEAGVNRVDFNVAASAIVPVQLEGFSGDLQFMASDNAIVPQRREDSWQAFLPATGRALMEWKSLRKTTEGKLFFTTQGRIEAELGSGLLQQSHHLSYQILQGTLESLKIQLEGPGEVLDVQGEKVLSWKVTQEGDSRLLEVVLSRPFETTSESLTLRTQTAIGGFPVRVSGMVVKPLDSLRHSGFLRLNNVGLVRIEPVNLAGLAQLSPDQFPGPASEARQVFVYRFPAADHSFSIAADRIQPEVNVSELSVYQLTDSDRRILADVELDIREAPIREWELLVPADYSVVSVTGSSVADYVVGTSMENGRKNLNVIFSQDVQGRQLVTLNLEKSEVASAGQWQLSRIEYPTANSVRGDVGVLGAPGFRLTVASTEMLLEKPISYFPKTSPYLQQAFRLREPNWSATMQVEILDQSVQADVLHLASLSEQTIYGSALINYFVTGAPVSEWKIKVPQALANVTVDGQDVRTWRREGDDLIVTLHQGVMGAYTLLVTFEQKPDAETGAFSAGLVEPIDVQGERGFIQLVSPLQVQLNTDFSSEELLKLDGLELPAEFRLLSSAPSLGTWQYTERPFRLDLRVDWFSPGSPVTQVVEFSEANSRVSKDGELVTDVVYYIKSRGARTLRAILPGQSVRLWEVTVNGQPVTARQADDATLIPLPGGTDPNIPVEVSLRLGKPATGDSQVDIQLPTLAVPVLKTKWEIAGDEKHVLVPTGGTVSPTEPAIRPTGWEWISRYGLIMVSMISGLCLVGVSSSFGLTGSLGTGGKRKSGLMLLLGLVSLCGAAWFSFVTAASAFEGLRGLEPIRLSLPVLAAGEPLEIQVANQDSWRVYIHWPGVVATAVGFFLIAISFAKVGMRTKMFMRAGGLFAVIGGALMQRDSAPWFFAVTTTLIVFLLLLPAAWRVLCWLASQTVRQVKSEPTTTGDGASGELGAVTSIIAFGLLSLGLSGNAFADGPIDFKPVDRLEQDWRLSEADQRLTVTGKIRLSGRPGDQFKLVSAPATVTSFDGQGLQLLKQQDSSGAVNYVMMIAVPDDEVSKQDQVESEQAGEPVEETTKSFAASFEYYLDAVRPLDGIPVLTGTAAVHILTLTYDLAGLEVACDAAVKIEQGEVEGKAGARLLLGPGSATVLLKPKSRDLSSEQTQFYVEGSNVYLPAPGVVDGLHRLRIRTSRGQVSSLEVSVPSKLTVSSVQGPVGAWQFDAERGTLVLAIEPPQAESFDITIETQRSIDPVPVSLELAPLTVRDSAGEVGLLAVAFGTEVQPGQFTSKDLSMVNLGDFDTGLLAGREAVLHRVYRYGKEGGAINVQLEPVAAEVRVTSQQVLSFGDERIVIANKFLVDITRAGLFQLSFPLPDRFEVESLTGAALRHWSELEEEGQRRVILHLNGKTLGTHEFSLTLAGNTPSDLEQWSPPRFEIIEATRQTGELIVRPTTGIRLRTVSRQNISETDPRTLGGQAQDALAFRLLQQDWDLVLGIEKLDPWITGQILHDVMLREGQTRTVLQTSFNIENASIRNLQVELPIDDAGVEKTLRVTGDAVSDIVRLSEDLQIWEVRFKRRVVGKVEFGIEYEKRGARQDDVEQFMPVAFPEVRQIIYSVAIRAGGRLELEHDELSEGWQRIDWNVVSPALKRTSSQTAPVFTLRAVSPEKPLVIRAKRHSLADALKLRITDAKLTTVLSPTGDQLTAVDAKIEVTQRSSLSVGLPEDGELFSIFVNGESVNSIRLDGPQPVWQFNILPGLDERTADLRFVYSVPGEGLNQLRLSSPEMNLPMENIKWDVVAPSGYRLIEHDGTLELNRRILQVEYDRESYLSKVQKRRESQAVQAEQLLEQANQLLQAGQQAKAKWAFNSVANQYALDAASNEDARVQLENLQTQQAVVGLNTRRQRLMLDNNLADAAIATNDQVREAAEQNPILQQEELNYRPQQISQLLQGNTSEDNAVLQQIANRLVQHQRSTDPAPQAIVISLPEGGSVYTFVRSVQVAERVPLNLNLSFDQTSRVRTWQVALSILLLLVFAVAVVGGRFSGRERGN